MKTSPPRKTPLQKVQQDVQAHPWVMERFPGIVQTTFPPAFSVTVDGFPHGLDWRILYVAFKKKTFILAFPEDRLIELGERHFQEECASPGSTVLS